MLLDGPAIARDPELSHLRLTPGLLRQWAHEGALQRHGTDARGRAVYDYDAVVALATARRNARQPRRRVQY